MQAVIVMASTGNEDRTAVHDVSLHPYVKLAITYMGLMIAFVIIGLVYYSVNLAYDPAEVASPTIRSLLHRAACHPWRHNSLPCK